MPEEEIQNVAPEGAEAVVPATESEDLQQEQRQEQKPKKKAKSDDQAYNWAEARRKMQELERKAQEQEQLIQNLQKPSQAVSEQDELDRMGDDDLMTKSQAKKMAERMAKQVAEQVIRQRENSTVDERLTNKFQDFSDVVTKENIELLKQTEPELALSLWKLQDDPYSQGVATYKLMKRLGIGQEEAPNPERDRALKNVQKPVSVQAVTKQSAIGNAHLFENGLTTELKSQLWKEMQQAMKG